MQRFDESRTTGENPVLKRGQWKLKRMMCVVLSGLWKLNHWDKNKKQTGSFRKLNEKIEKKSLSEKIIQNLKSKAKTNRVTKQKLHGRVPPFKHFLLSQPRTASTRIRAKEITSRASLLRMLRDGFGSSNIAWKSLENHSKKSLIKNHLRWLWVRLDEGVSITREARPLGMDLHPIRRPHRNSHCHPPQQLWQLYSLRKQTTTPALWGYGGNV